MRTTLLIHILAGSLALVAGYVALFTAKGAALHRKSGRLFVYAMLTMCACGVVIALPGAWRVVNVPAALMTAYLVTTSLLTVRPPAAPSRPRDLALMLVALTVGLVCLTFGLEAIAAGGKRDGIPAFPFFLFGLVGLLGGAGDFRMLRSGPPRGAARIARHLWRMSFALLVAAMSFFIGQAKVLPKAIRIPWLLALPVLTVLVAMLYGLWRVRRKTGPRHSPNAAAPEAPSPGPPGLNAAPAVVAAASGIAAAFGGGAPPPAPPGARSVGSADLDAA